MSYLNHEEGEASQQYSPINRHLKQQDKQIDFYVRVKVPDSRDLTQPSQNRLMMTNKLKLSVSGQGVE